MTAIVKFIHVGAISVWSAGLIVLPFLVWQSAGMPDGWNLDRLHRLTRFVHVNLASPAAFLAIASGTLLIFLRETFLEWFSIKLLAVAAMTIVHILIGVAVIRTFEERSALGLAPNLALMAGTLAAVVTTLFFVLAKPAIDSQQLAAAFFEPGALGVMVRQFFDDTNIPIP
ncbi:hypothetical protein BH23PSE1_BH23PSE1_08180 [soil metagenome]